MTNEQQTTHSGEPGGEARLSFDQYVAKLPDSKHSIHRWLGRLLVVALVLPVGVFIYAIYASFNAKSLGEAHVVSSWLFFLMAGALLALLLGIQTLVVGATVPLPFEQSKYDYETGPKAIQSGRSLIGIGGVVLILGVVGVAAVQAGRFSLENWIQMVVGFWALVGLGSAALAILRRILQPR